MADNSKALTIMQGLMKMGDSDIQLGGLTKMEIQRWQTERKEYEDSPFGINYKLLELAETEDPNSEAAKFKHLIDTLPPEQIHDVDVTAIYLKYVKGKTTEEIDWEKLENDLKEYKSVLKIFEDEASESNEPEIEVQTAQLMEQKLGDMFERNRDSHYYIIEAQGLVLYVKSTEPEIYKTNHSIEVRYFSGDKLRRFRVGLGITKINRDLLNNDNYELRTSSGIEIEKVKNFTNRPWLDGRSWLDGNLEKIIDKYEAQIRNWESMISRETKLKTMLKMDAERSALTDQYIDELRKTIERAELQLSGLRQEKIMVDQAKDLEGNEIVPANS